MNKAGTRLVLLLCLLVAGPSNAMTRVGRHTARRAAPKVAKEVTGEAAERGVRDVAPRAALQPGLIPAADLPRLTRYADAADSPATRQLLMEAYAREGPGLFERIPPRLVLASGLTTSMILGTHRATEPAYQAGQRIRDVPVDQIAGAVSDSIHNTATVLVAFICLLTLLLFWRCGVFRKRKSAHPPAVTTHDN
jgi:hypothetical protein